MPKETQDAVNWALQQTVTVETYGTEIKITKDTPSLLVNKVREYFNTSNVSYGNFSYDDLKPLLN